MGMTATLAPSTSHSGTAVGEGAGHRFVRSVATAGDLDGDGRSDVVVGAASRPSATAPWTAVGQATNGSLGRSVAYQTGGVLSTETLRSAPVQSAGATDEDPRLNGAA